MIEEWKSFPKFSRYLASNFGRMKRLAYTSSNGRFWPEIILKTNPKYRHISARRDDGKNINLHVSHAVLFAFVGPKPSPKHVARHLDDNIANNRLDNLAWGTQSENFDDAIKNGVDYGAHLRGKKRDPEIVKNIAKKLTGRKNGPHSIETKERMAESGIRHWKQLKAENPQEYERRRALNAINSKKGIEAASLKREQGK